MSAPIGVASPWALIPQLSAWFLLLYVMHASFRIWRKANRHERRGVLTLAVATMIFEIAAAGQGALILTGVIISPPFISFPFLAIILAMSFELSQDVLRATRLARVVESNEERLALAQEAAEIGTFDWDIQTGNRATRRLRGNERQGVSARMLARLESPEMLAIERRYSTRWEGSGDRRNHWCAGGAGSVYVQGKDNLELPSGTEITIRSSAPSQ